MNNKSLVVVFGFLIATMLVSVLVSVVIGTQVAVWSGASSLASLVLASFVAGITGLGCGIGLMMFVRRVTE